MKAPQYVLDWLVEGVKIDFLLEPESMSTRNNKSARDNPDFVEKSLEELLKFGLIEEVDKPPKVVNPLSVAFTSKNKPRLCIDMSMVNDHCPKQHFKLDDEKVFF